MVDSVELNQIVAINIRRTFLTGLYPRMKSYFGTVAVGTCQQLIVLEAFEEKPPHSEKRCEEHWWFSEVDLWSPFNGRFRQMTVLPSLSLHGSWN